MERNRYADLLRVGAICLVALGHWLLVDVTYCGGRLAGVDALDYVSWGRWVTLLFQVTPVFFLVGGYVNALSWTAHQERGESRTVWIRDRVLGMLWPTTAYVTVAELVVASARIAGAGPAELPAGLGPAGPWSPVLLLAGLAAVSGALARLAIAGFAPGGHVPAAILAVYACGLTLI